MEEKNKNIFLIISVILLTSIGLVCIFLNGYKMEKTIDGMTTTTTKKTTARTTIKRDDDEEDETPVYRNGLLVMSLEDKINKDAAWCGTFNIIWNDLKNDLVKGDVVWTTAPMDSLVKHLNKGTFTTKELDSKSYYKKVGHASKELKEEIEKAIYKKFKQKSDILDDFDWDSVNPLTDYFLYAMLYKEFEYEKAFTKLGKYSFNGSDEKYEYFGINHTTSKEVFKNIKVIWYEDSDHFIAMIKTKGNDELLIYKGYTEDNFLDAYNRIITEEGKETAYEFGEEGDSFRMPFIKTDIKEEIKEVMNKEFLFSNGDSYSIDKALQTIKFELTNKGGKVKSEAGMIVAKNAIGGEDNNIHLDVDKEFMLFIREKGSNLPYLALDVRDMSLFS